MEALVSLCTSGLRIPVRRGSESRRKPSTGARAIALTLLSTGQVGGDLLQEPAVAVGVAESACPCHTAAFDATDFDRLRVFFDELPTQIDHVLVTGPRICRPVATRKMTGSPSSAESSSSASGHDMGAGPLRSWCAPHCGGSVSTAARPRPRRDGLSRPCGAAGKPVQVCEAHLARRGWKRRREDRGRIVEYGTR
jgi:hypothetical protein